MPGKVHDHFIKKLKSPRDSVVPIIAQDAEGRNQPKGGDYRGHSTNQGSREKLMIRSDPSEYRMEHAAQRLQESKREQNANILPHTLLCGGLYPFLQKQSGEGIGQGDKEGDDR